MMLHRFYRRIRREQRNPPSILPPEVALFPDSKLNIKFVLELRILTCSKKIVMRRNLYGNENDRYNSKPIKLKTSIDVNDVTVNVNE